VVVWGHSLGSFLATHVAAEREVAGVVLENPATTVDDWVDHLIPWYIRLFLGVDVDSALRAESNLKRVRHLQAPLLVVAGSDDNVTNPKMARRLHEQAGSPDKTLIVVEEGSHNGLYDDPEVQAAYQQLVQRVTDGASASASAPSAGSPPAAR
jgi:pimeloyl-ACP methyl ester carboxylesterase